MNRSPIPLLLLVAAACGSARPSGRDLGGPPPGFRGFPPQSLEENVYSQAGFDGAHARRFGVDLTAKGVLPIELQVRLAGAGGEPVLLSSERLDLRLFLQDGTALPALATEDVVVRAPKTAAENVRRYAFRPTLLTEETLRGFVYFDLGAAGDYSLEGRTIVRAEDGCVRTSDVLNSLVAFNASVGGRLQPFYVGIQR